MRKIQSIYTDGACTGNPGPGGWGVVVYFTDGEVSELGGYEAQTTNNRMEMQAAIAALKLLASAKQSEPVTLYTDSEYLIKGVTQWVRGWKKKGWKTAQGKPVLNQDIWETLDQLNTLLVKWQYVRGHAGNVGNERCDMIARAFANGKSPSLRQMPSTHSDESTLETNQIPVAEVSDSDDTPTLTYKNTQTNCLASNITMTELPAPSPAAASEDLPRELRVAQLRNLVETLRIADEIATKGYLITSSELADLMDVHASAVTSRGDEWRWRNWIVSRVRREGNQILWELERGDGVVSIPEMDSQVPLP
jgi:ribonuclease HI